MIDACGEGRRRAWAAVPFAAPVREGSEECPLWSKSGREMDS